MQTLVKGPERSPVGPVPIHPIVMVADDLRRYFVPEKQVVTVNLDSDLSRYQTFGLFQQSRGRSKSVVSLGPIREDTPFDEHGRRTVSINTPDGVLKVIQGVEKLHPHALKVVGLTHVWELGIDPRSVPPDTLDGMLRTATKRDNPDHRLAIFKFYLQMEVYDRAGRELEGIQADFPEMTDQVSEYRRVLRQVQAQQLFNELRLRQAAGQHGLAFSLSKKFPIEDVNAALLQQVRSMTTAYHQTIEQADRAKLLLGELQAKLTNAEQVAAVAPIRTEMSEKLSYFSLERLKPFFEQVPDPDRPIDEKLALALSGWVLGAAYAVDDLDLSIRLWKARSLVLEFLREPLSSRREAILSQLSQVEGIGPERIARLVPYLPPIRETDEPQSGPARMIRVPANGGREPAVKLVAAKGKETGSGESSPARYGVVLPFEYHTDHTYPLIIALRGAGRTLEQELEWWGGTPDKPGQSQRHGYIVIAPDYVPVETRTYEYPVEAHRIVIDSLHDACLRFRVDTNRVFIAGHDMGGDAAFDIGFSHPDRFAGVIAIGGTIERFAQYYRKNAKPLPIYIVGGELDAAAREKNAADITWMMERNYDVIYAEYVGHGRDGFYPEIHHLFDWMRRYARTLHPDKIEFDVMRTSEDRVHWLTFDGLPQDVLSGGTDPRKAKRPMQITAQFQKGSNTVVVMCGARNVSIWLTPDLVDFEKRLTVRLNANLKWNKPLTPDVPRMLEDLRVRGDRQQLYWAVLDF
jgi:pimeloyl-ACP methyl ester carboxylesterase